jgi:ParB family chromosome partitioning protein
MGLHKQYDLGKTAKAVYERTARREMPSNGGRLEVDVGLIRPPTKNPRHHFDDEALNELAESIRQHGFIQPIVVLRHEVGYEVLSGERRFRAAKLIGLDKVPVIIHQGGDEREVAQLRLIENIQREDLNPIEVAEAYQTLISEHNLTQEQVAEQVGKNRSSISNSLRLLTLPESVRTLVAGGRLSMGHARALAALRDEGACIALAKRCLAEDLSVRTIEELVRKQVATGEVAAPSRGRSKRSPAVAEAEHNLARLLGTKVAIKERGGKGHVNIHFQDTDHFNDLVDRIAAALGPGGGL